MLSEYKVLDRHLRSVLRDINTAKHLYRLSIDTLLSIIIVDENRRNVMLHDLTNKEWNMDCLDSQLCLTLGKLLIPVTNSIHGMREAMKNIEDILRGLIKSEHDICMGPGSTIGLAATTMVSGVIASATSMYHEVRRVQANSTQPKCRRKLKVAVSGTVKELQMLRKTMTRHNCDLQAVIYSLGQNPRPAKPSSQHPLLTPPITKQFTGTTQSPADPRKIQIASRKLHGIVCKSLRIRCQCHLLHLCLGNLTPVITADGISEIQSPTPIPQFRFLLSKSAIDECVCEHGLPDIGHPTPYLVFESTNRKINSASPPTNGCGLQSSIYKELLSLGEQFEKHFHDETVGFTLRGLQTATPSSNPVVSLDQLISCSSGGLENLGCVQIATNLATSVLSFYASPWIRDWTLETIQCYDRTAGVDLAEELWMPHVPVKFTSDIGIKNREVHALGLILLQLGRKQRLENVDGEDEEVLVSKALWDLHKKMGRQYRRVVENCIQKWGNGDLDLMEEENLNGFRSDIRELEKLVECFTPSI
ncbi:hypothetical protein BDD12DRAFT_887110 [Trichophaea hybrida]|nr:hypothetical protein BDD12DRAFT_887110 [Trichophaea hybrida]